MKEFFFTLAHLSTVAGKKLGSGYVREHPDKLAVTLDDSVSLRQGDGVLARLDSNRIAMTVMVTFSRKSGNEYQFDYPAGLAVETVDAAIRMESSLSGAMLLNPHYGTPVAFADPIQGMFSFTVPREIPIGETVLIVAKTKKGQLNIKGKVVFASQIPEVRGYRYGIRVEEMLNNDVPSAVA